MARDLTLEDVVVARNAACDLGGSPFGRLVVVGQAPGREQHPESDGPLFPWPANSSGGRLFGMSGLTLAEWFVCTERRNTIRVFPGSHDGKGHMFDPGIARGFANALTRELNLHERVCLFVGKTNASCYEWPWDGVPKTPGSVVKTDEGGHWSWIPHTSGIVTHWNSRENRDDVRRVFSDLMALL